MQSFNFLEKCFTQATTSTDPLVGADDVSGMSFLCTSKHSFNFLKTVFMQLTAKTEPLEEGQCQFDKFYLYYYTFHEFS